MEQICVDDAWPPAESTIVPTYVLNLDLPPKQRWLEISKTFKPQVYNLFLKCIPEMKVLITCNLKIQELVTYIKAFILEFNPKLQSLIKIIENDLVISINWKIEMLEMYSYLYFKGKIVSTLPEPYADELEGIASTVEVPLGDIVLYNIFYEIFTVCTSIVSQDENGHITHARNLDFGLFMGWDVPNRTWTLSEKLRPLTINVNFTRGGELQYITSGFAGFIGVFTGNIYAQ